MKFILDTNFLLLPGRLKLDIFAELRQFEGKRELYTLDLVVAELQKLAQKKTDSGRAAILALTLMRAYKMRILPAQGTDTDSELIEAADEHQAVVCTQDIPLRRRLRGRKLPVVFLRQRRHLILEP